MGSTGVEIQLLGRMSVSQTGQRLGLSLAGATLELLAYLLCHADEVRRDALAALMWEEVEPERARGALNTALWRIKKQVRSWPGIALISTPAAVRLDLGGCRLDVSQLEAAVRTARGATRTDDGVLKDEVRADLAEAADLYRGPFLDGCGSSWALVERERLFDVHLRVLGLLMQDSSSRRDYDEALDYGRRLLVADPFHEQAQCQVMWLYALNGQRVRALVQYRSYEELLRREMSIRPIPEARALFEFIRSELDQDEVGLPVRSADSRRAGAGVDLLGRLNDVIANSRADAYGAVRP